MKRKLWLSHKCHGVDYCTCNVMGTEPDEFCPFHGGAVNWPPRCFECGKFLKFHKEISHGEGTGEEVEEGE
jgi:hypothetical protein